MASARRPESWQPSGSRPAGRPRRRPDPAGRSDGVPGGARFALFAECLLVGVLVTVAALPVVTLLPALAAGADHIRAHVDGESTTLRAFAGRLRAAYPGGWVWSLGAAAGFALLALDAAVVRGGDLPGAAAVAVVAALAGTGLAVLLLRVAAAWSAGAPWPTLVRATARRAVVGDPGGSLLLVLAIGVLLVVGWQFLPLAVPMLGCVLMAAVAVDRRRTSGPGAPTPAGRVTDSMGQVTGATRREAG